MTTVSKKDFYNKYKGISFYLTKKVFTISSLATLVAFGVAVGSIFGANNESHKPFCPKSAHISAGVFIDSAITTVILLAVTVVLWYILSGIKVEREKEIERRNRDIEEILDEYYSTREDIFDDDYLDNGALREDLIEKQESSVNEYSAKDKIIKWKNLASKYLIDIFNKEQESLLNKPSTDKHIKSQEIPTDKYSALTIIKKWKDQTNTYLTNILNRKQNSANNESSENTSVDKQKVFANKHSIKIPNKKQKITNSKHSVDMLVKEQKNPINTCLTNVSVKKQETKVERQPYRSNL